MTPPVEPPLLSDWELHGKRVAPALDGCAAVVVIGEDGTSAAEVALGIARAHARRRRVVVGDGVGELGPIEDLVPVDAPYGLIDFFVYGVSLTKVAHPVDPARNLFVIPSGTAPIDHDALFASEEWARLIRDFRIVEALLLVVVPAHQAGVGALASAMDGAVLVGRVVPPAGAPVRAHIRPDGVPLLAPPRASARPGLPDDFVANRDGAGEPVPLTADRTATAPARVRLPPPVVLAGGIAAVVVAAVAWALLRPVSSHTGSADGDHAAPVAAAPVAAAPDSTDTLASAGSDSSAPVGAPLALTDSAHAVPYSVQVEKFGSASSAISRLELESRHGLGALTYSPVASGDGGRSYRLLVGAFRDTTAALAMLRQLRAEHIVAAGRGHIVRTPFALLLNPDVERDLADVYVRAYRGKGLPAYALVQPNGKLSLFAGAFATAEDADLLLASFRANGDKPTVTYRIGRTP
ncbi:MAG TPA: SPOR domain-containing protein [Gemmatimonadaceae bacterium]|nr:SPOR domain-containing protein [Gemmatimonadaceae bacterium]